MTPFSLRPPVLSDPDSNPEKLTAIGQTVREHLSARADVRDVGGETLDLYIIRRFLGAEECARIVEVIDSKIGPSTLYEGTEIDGFRTSSTHHFDSDDPATISLQSKICETLGIDRQHAEVMQGQRYSPDQQFRHHHDFFHQSEVYWSQEKKRGGQRTWTAMVFLNEAEAGGETDFSSIKLKIPPKTGAIVIWNNMDRKGRPNHHTLHAGLPVLAGRKYVITQWFRQNAWKFDPHRD